MKVKPCPRCKGRELTVYRAFVIKREYEVNPDTGELDEGRQIDAADEYGEDQARCNHCGIWFAAEYEEEPITPEQEAAFFKALEENLKQGRINP